MSQYWEKGATDEQMNIGLSGRSVWHASKEQQKSKYMTSVKVSVHVGWYIFEYLALVIVLKRTLKRKEYSLEILLILKKSFGDFC